MYDTVKVYYKPYSGRCNQLQLAPNTGTFEIQLEKARKGRFQLYSSSGKQTEAWQIADGLPLKLSLSPGMYLLRCTTADGKE